MDEEGFFEKTSQISEGRLPPEDVSVCLENLWRCFSDDIAKILVPGVFLDEVGFFETNLKFRKVVYPPRMSPF